MSERRPNPDTLLARAKEEEIPQGGKLKIYLGAAPGVGKTYTMLQDARAKREQGLDVLAGVVESHGRKEIEALLQHIEILPRRLIEYHGKPLLEFDLDAALNRNPGLILIDEMAHTNIPGLRHSKRWQDIKELLDRGIDVYTTLNVQHIESLNDDIAKIIGIKVRETVPDLFLDLADTIEVVDLSPDDLLKRLQDGKVYISTQAELATKHFFKKANLTALRELALRATADRVDDQVLQQRRGQGIEHTWPTKERLLVCIGSTSASAKVIRAACRMAASLHAAWIVIHVETPQQSLSDEQRKIAVQNLRLAEQLGAETRILTGLDVVEEILKFAREKNVTKIVMGKHKRPRWRDFVFGSLVDELVRLSGEVDIYIIRGDQDESKSIKPTPSKTKIAWKSYFLALVAIVFTTAINLLIYPTIGLSNLVMIYMLGVVMIAIRGQVGPTLFTAFAVVLTYVYIFIPPYFRFTPSDAEYLFMLLIMMSVAYIISHLTIVNRQQSEIAHFSEQRASALHALTRQLASTRGIDKLLDIATNYIAAVFNGEVLALLSEDNQLVIRAASSTNKVMTAKDQGVAQWVYDIGQVAGLGTDTLPYSDSVYVPLQGSHGPVGVLKVHPKVADKLLIPEQLRLLESCANQIALALEVDRLQEKAKSTQIAIETERLRTALFSSLSNELRNPLASIVHLIKNFVSQKSQLPAEATAALVQEIERETDRLNRLINNLLQITQLEEGVITLHKRPHSIEHLIQTALSRVEKILGDKVCNMIVPSHLPLVPFDTVLMEQVLVNLIENAIQYTPPDTPIDISASLEDDEVLITVADRGAGLSQEEIDKVFEKFYRGSAPQKESGAGLGLTVCQSIIKAHGGRIWAENRWGGGSMFYLILPIHEK